MIDHQQILYALERARKRLQAQADALGAAHDYNAEFFAEDAQRMVEAAELVSAALPPVSEAEERKAFEVWKVENWVYVDDEKSAWQIWLGARAALSAPVPPGYKLLKDTTHDERSFPEDTHPETGGYHSQCHNCLRMFVGYKRRVTCRVCAAPSPKEPQK